MGKGVQVYSGSEANLSCSPFLMRFHLLPALALLLLFTQCKKDDPISALPPETQTGAGTFGCLVNGQPWTPLGNNGYSNYSVSYDPTYANGTLNVGCYRYVGTGADDYQLVGFFLDSMKTAGIYSLTSVGHREGIFADRSRNTCQFMGGDPYYRRGQLIITRLDKQAGVISGTFAYTLYKPGCDSVRITQGRFDRKL
jgi:hypothetical protein